jgi:hypothetical protein
VVEASGFMAERALGRSVAVVSGWPFRWAGGAAAAAGWYWMVWWPMLVAIGDPVVGARWWLGPLGVVVGAVVSVSATAHRAHRAWSPWLRLGGGVGLAVLGVLVWVVGYAILFAINESDALGGEEANPAYWPAVWMAMFVGPSIALSGLALLPSAQIDLMLRFARWLPQGVADEAKENPWRR